MHRAQLDLITQIAKSLGSTSPPGWTKHTIQLVIHSIPIHPNVFKSDIWRTVAEAMSAEVQACRPEANDQVSFSKILLIAIANQTAPGVRTAIYEAKRNEYYVYVNPDDGRMGGDEGIIGATVRFPHRPGTECALLMRISDTRKQPNNWTSTEIHKPEHQNPSIVYPGYWYFFVSRHKMLLVKLLILVSNMCR